MRVGRLLCLAILLVLLIAAVYSNSLDGNWLFDDEEYIVKDERIRQLWPPTYLVGTSRPVVYASLAMNFAISKFDVFSYHLFNLMVHIACAVFLWHFLYRFLGLPRWGWHSKWHRVILSFLPVLLWSLHPIQTMAVSYIWQRCELLMALVFLFALNSLMLRLEKGTPSRWGIVCIAAVWGGIMTKEIMVTFPPVALLFDYVFFSGSLRKIWKQRKGLYLGLFSSWIALFLIMKVWGMAYHTNTDIGFASNKYTPLGYLLVVPGAHLQYLKLLFYPVGLCFDYVWFPVQHWTEVAWPLLFVGPLVAASLLGVWKRKAWAWGVLTYFLILAPTTSFMPMPDPVFEYRVYLPSAFLLSTAYLVLCWAVLSGLGRLGGQGERLLRLLGLLALALVFAFGSMTYQRNLAYTSNYALWRRTLLVSPQNRRARYNMVVACLRSNNGKEAEPHLRYLLQGEPEKGYYFYCLGLSLLYQEKLNRALTAFTTASEMDGLKAEYLCETYFLMGHVLYRLGDHKQARTMLLKSKAVIAEHRASNEPMWQQVLLRVDSLLQIVDGAAEE